MRDKNAEKWEEIYSGGKAGSFLRYPNENLVTLFFHHRKLISPESVGLDFGFGSGNNSEFLIQHIRELHGVEVSEGSVRIARERLGRFAGFLPEKFAVGGDWRDRSGCYDLIVAWQVLCYNDAAGVHETIGLFHKLLKPGGVLMCTLTTPRDMKATCASVVDRDTYEIDQRIPHQQGCRVYVPGSELDFLGLFPQFETLDYGYYERASRTNGNAASEYFLVARK